jgi:hypothetical protein
MQDFLREMILATNFTLKGFRESGPSIQEVLKWLDLGSAEENHENAVSFFPSDEEDLKTAASFFRWLFHLPRTYETVVTIDTDNAEGSVTLVLNLLDEHSAPNRPQLDHHKKEFQLVLPTGAGPFDSGGASLVGKAFRDASIGDVFIFASGKRYWLFAVPESGDRVDDVKGVLAEILLWAANLPGRCRWEDLSVPAVAYYEMRTLRDR